MSELRISHLLPHSRSSILLSLSLAVVALACDHVQDTGAEPSHPAPEANGVSSDTDATSPGESASPSGPTATDTDTDAGRLKTADPNITGPTCKDILAANPRADSGLFNATPQGSPFAVRCDMKTDGGGWTLVGIELPQNTGQFRFLDVDSKNPTAIAYGIASGLVGQRFIGKYKDVRIEWNNEKFIKFTLPTSFDLFSNSANLDVNITSVTTSEDSLSTWFAAAGGAKLCVASQNPLARPGNTSWAIKALDDGNTACGCSGAAWLGRGAFYGGAASGENTTCDGWGGGWAGVKDTGEQKGGVTPTYETRIWVR